MFKLPKNIFMIGIGGIGMSALAQLLKHQGCTVTGSDREISPTTELLVEKGITVAIGHDGCLIPSGTDLVIYSDAVWPDNPERMRAKDMKIPEMSYFHALGEVSRGTKTFIAVAGTHGKTTTTGMITAVLKDAEKHPTAVIGSIVKDFGSNFVAGDNDLFVVEACEYKNHLLELDPNILVVTNIEWDHTDFFPTLEAFQDSFKKAIEKVPSNGAVVTNPHDPNIAPLLKSAKAKIIDYTLETAPKLEMLGAFNEMNARAAIAAARAAFPELSNEIAAEALRHFKGSWRRWEYKGETKNGALVYDDYAHHPTAIEKTIRAAKEKFPTKEITVVFHPHLFSRTRDLFEGFVQSLALADDVIVAPIYAARELPIEGVTSEALADAINKNGTPAKAFATLHEIYLYLSTSYKLHATTLLITMGAGDIYKVAEQITEE